MDTTTHTATVSDIKRLTNSCNGNPRFEIAFSDGRKAKTATDISDAYAISHGWVGQLVRFTLKRTKHLTIGTIELVRGRS